jgi:threonine aldolase
MEKCALTGPRPVSVHPSASLTASARTRAIERTSAKPRSATTRRLIGAGRPARYDWRVNTRIDTPPPVATRRRQFASDNQSAVCPEAWDALARANAAGHTPSYGDDPWTARAADLLRELFETDCDVYFTFNGTAANSLALASLGQSYHAVVCHEGAHVETSECNAVGFFSGGMKLLPCRGEVGKIDPAEVERAVGDAGADVHASLPRALSFAQATEVGTVYAPAELAHLCGRAKRLGLRVHMDGARIANAIAHLGCTPAETTWKAGVDVLSFGGTKNGTAMCEAVVFFDRALSAGFGHRVMQAGQLASKMRFMAAQWVGVLETGAWRRHAARANAMAKRLEAGLRDITSLGVLFPVQANAVFVEMPRAVQEGLRRRGWDFFTFVGDTGARLMCSWDTAEEDVDAFVDDVRALCQACWGKPRG